MQNKTYEAMQAISSRDGGPVPPHILGVLHQSAHPECTVICRDSKMMRWSDCEVTEEVAV